MFSASLRGLYKNPREADGRRTHDTQQPECSLFECKNHSQLANQSLLPKFISIVFQLEDYISAEKYLKEAISLATQIPDMTETGVYQANLGLLYLHQGILDQARKFCSTAWHYGKEKNSPDTVAQADFCLDQIKKATEKTPKKQTNYFRKTGIIFSS